MNSGDDTAFYLSKGYSVVAIEAIPERVASAHKRFRKAIQTGKLVILNVAIAEKTGKRDFWVCEQISAWSSFDKTIAGREGSKCRRIKVKTRRFRDVLGKFGTPCYLKIDIEGADVFCLADLDNDNLPTFISVETECGERDVPLTARRYLATLNQLRELGYSRFKLVNQYACSCISFKSQSGRGSSILGFCTSRNRTKKQVVVSPWRVWAMGQRLNRTLDGLCRSPRCLLYLSGTFVSEMERTLVFLLV